MPTIVTRGAASAKALGFTQSTQYRISRSLRFRSSASAYLNRTPGSATNRTTWTYSCWAKLGLLNNYGGFFAAGSNNSVFMYDINGNIQYYEYNGTSVTSQLITTQVFRDPSAWYHIVLTVDTTQATASNRTKLYINGSQVTAFSTATYPSQNATTYINSTVIHYIGYAAFTGRYFDGYLTEVNFIDGQALSPSSFGQNNPATGVWEPIRYGGSYGTNGFYLNFSDNSAATAAAIGKDYSGNGNNWTPNNISVTAGTTYDSMIDVPTPYDDGSTNRGNYCVLNPLTAGATGCANGNLTLNFNSNSVLSTFGVSSGKWYYETTLTTQISDQQVVGLSVNGFVITTPVGNDVYSWGIIIQGNVSNGQAYHNGITTNTGVTYAPGDVAMVAFDMATGRIWFGKNGTWLNSGNPAAGTSPIYSNLSAPAYPTLSNRVTSGGVLNANFGQRPFAYTPPSGFQALNTFNLAAPTTVAGNVYMNATTYTGTGSALTVTNAGLTQPDMVWTKKRSSATDSNNIITDSVRGIPNILITNATSSESAIGTEGVQSFTSSGFTLGARTSTTGDNFNANGSTYVAWQWRAANGSNVTNTTGTLTSTVSANTTAGFSIVTYTGTGSVGTIGHGLGAVPKMIIVKARSLSGRNWSVYSSVLGPTYVTWLNLTSASSNSGRTGYWNDTSPTSTVFTVGTDNDTNANTYTYVAYCWAEVDGFSKFGSYTGNGSADGPFVYCGFRPRWIMVKNYSSAGNGWAIRDTARDTYNVANQTLIANSTAAEATALYNIDIVSNGFKIRDTGTDSNGSGTSYIFAAFAENPFKYALAR